MKKIFSASLPLVLLISFLIVFSSTGNLASEKRTVTFSKDVAPILFNNCVACHRPDDIAPMSLLSYKDARPWARSIKEKILAHEMPPWSADPKVGAFSNDPSLPQKDIDTVVAWVDGGAAEGNPRDLPPVPNFSDKWEIGKPDVVFQMPEEFEVSAAGADDYIYFRVPTGFTEDKWIQAAEFRPGNKRVVHHAVVFLETPEMMMAARAASRGRSANDKNTPSFFELGPNSLFRKEGTVRRVRDDVQVIDDGCNSSNGGGLGGGTGGMLLAVYAPGRNADIWPEGTAKRIPAGSNLIFQMHYSKTTGKAEKDRTSVGLLFARAPVQKMILSHDTTNFFFRIPAGAENHEATACYTLPKDIQLVNFMPHMHVRGKDMKYEAIYPDGRRETLLSVPRYNFNWQALYKLKSPISLPKGTRIVVTAHFDNSARNKHNPDPTRNVRFGEPTYDEMLVGFFDYITDKPREKVVAKIDPAIYDSYAGQYTVGPGVSFSVLREGDRLLVALPGQPKIEVFPESETKFFVRLLDAQVTFLRNDKGETTGLLFEMTGQSLRAKKVSKVEPTAQKQ